MIDYSKKTKAVLIEILEEKENSYNTLLEETNAKDDQIIALQEQLEGNDGEDGADEQDFTAYDIIDAILVLPEAEKEILPALIRTDPDGIKAYACFLYGGCQNGGGIKIIPKGGIKKQD